MMNERFIDLRGESAFLELMQPILFDEDSRFGADWLKMTGVNSKEQISYLDRPNSVLQSAAGCSMDPTPILAQSNRFVNPVPVGIYTTFCKNQIRNTALQAALSNKMRPSDITGTQYEQVILDFCRDGIHKDLEAIGFFGNKASTDPVLSLVDGIWGRVMQLNMDNLTEYVDTGSGAPLATGDTLDILEDMWKKQADVLYGLPAEQKIIYVTRNFHDQYVADLQARSINSSAFVGLVAETEAFAYKYRGIEIKVMPSWDSTIAEEFGVRYANYVLLTARRNFVLATDGGENTMDSLEVWFSRDDNQWKVRTEFMLDINYARHEMMVAGY